MKLKQHTKQMQLKSDKNMWKGFKKKKGILFLSEKMSRGYLCMLWMCVCVCESVLWMYVCVRVYAKSEFYFLKKNKNILSV